MYSYHLTTRKRTTLRNETEIACTTGNSLDSIREGPVRVLAETLNTLSEVFHISLLLSTQILGWHIKLG
jgi:hypothetical protein